MRASFVVASLVVHAGVVCLAFQAARQAEPKPTIQRAPLESGLVSVDLAQAGAAYAREQPQTPPVEERSMGATDERPMEENEANEQPKPNAVPPAPAAEPANPPRAEPTPKPRVTQKEPTERVPAAKAASSSRTTTLTPAAPAPGDWLSIDQQLPEEETKPREPRSEKPVRDELVERLLAKERDRQAVERRQELARAQVRRVTEASSVAPSESTGPASEVVGGQSHESADVWVELTRWLPRAASSDPAWETLATDTRFDVRVRVRQNADSTLDVSAVGDAPEVVVRLLRATAHLMQRGKFANAAVERRFTLRIRLSRTAERELWIAHTTPDPPKPGVGSFVAASGRRFDVWVTAEP